LPYYLSTLFGFPSSSSIAYGLKVIPSYFLRNGLGLLFGINLDRAGGINPRRQFLDYVAAPGAGSA
jgi:hypothetical protein